MILKVDKGLQRGMYWFFGLWLLFGIAMINDDNQGIDKLAACLDEIQLKLYYAAVRSARSASKTTYRLVSKKDISGSSALDDLFQKGVALNDITRGTLTEYFLVFQLGGELTTIDEVDFVESRIDKNEIIIELAVTKVESQDGVPVPVTGFVLLPLNETILARSTLVLTAKGVHRSFAGKSGYMKKSPIEAVSVSLSNDQ